MTSFLDAIANVSPELQFVDLDLSTAQTNFRIGFGGTVIFADDVGYDITNVAGDTLDPTLSTGYAFARINEVNGKPFLLQGGRLLRLSPFSELFLTWPAQSGKMLRLYISTGEMIEPFSSRVDVAGGVTIANDPYGLQANEYSVARNTGALTSGYTRYELQNPASSGRILHCRSIQWSASLASNCQIGRDALTPTGSSVTPRSKGVITDPGVAAFINFDVASTIIQRHAEVVGVAGVSQVVRFFPPLQVGEGDALAFRIGPGNPITTASVEYGEQVI